MTEAIVNDIPVIGPDYGNLGYLIQSNRLGETFIAEDPKSLGTTISKIIDNQISTDKNFKSLLNVKTFTQSY
ncbi:hypothetical protein V7114_26850, partial [Neobacillus niacini]|uniref:hypothetical protein n=1 Tax=Neobacillus niacini TaxID=86668 RepID=UPI002FFD762F